MAISEVKKEEQLNMESLSWGDLTWINIEKPTERETEYLAKNYPFHHLDLDDCLSRKQRPKIDEYEDYLFFIFHHSVYSKETRVSRHDQVSVFVGKNYLITLHGGELKTLVKLFRDCQLNEDVRKENFSNGSGYLLYRILDRAIDAYFPILNKIQSLVEDIEDRVYDENIETGQEIAVLRRDVITQRRIAFPNRVIFGELEHKLERYTTMDISVYFGDLIDHLNKICDTLDEMKETIEVFKDTDFVLSTYRLNSIVRVLTVLGSITLPFVAIASIYGMNVTLPGGLERGSAQSFFVLLAAMLAISGVMLYFFHRKRWI